MQINQLLKIIADIIEAVKEALRQKRIRELRREKEQALQDKDQRSFEESLGGSSGPASPGKYHGLFTRPRKKKE